MALMVEVLAPQKPLTPEGWRLRWGIVKQRCGELGATDDATYADLLGVSLATLYRWRKGTADPSFGATRRAAERLGLPSDAMWERASA